MRITVKDSVFKPRLSTPQQFQDIVDYFLRMDKF